VATTSGGGIELSDLGRYNYDPCPDSRSKLSSWITSRPDPMARREDEIHRLRTEIFDREAELTLLKTRLRRVEGQDVPADDATTVPSGRTVTPPDYEALGPGQITSGQDATSSSWRWPLSREEYQRYGRQMITPEIGLEGEPTVAVIALFGLTKDTGQLRLKQSSMLIVGVGGLGCPAAAYLAGAGVGTLGLVDGDTVETSNLHRQILHNTRKVGMSKVNSAMEFLREYVYGYESSISQGLTYRFNPNTNYKLHHENLTPQTAPNIVAQYDLVLDCTDHPKSRYLISDAALLLGKPLVSASALRTEGQLMTLNNPPKPPGDQSGGPCYRCIFPKPPPAESVISCGDGGILGPVVGVMGVLQALAAIKLTASRCLSPDVDQTYPQPPSQPEAPSLLLFSAYGSPPFRNVRLRPRRQNCMACSSTASVTLQSLLSGSLDYVQFCGVTQPLQLLREEERISAEHLKALTERPASEYLLVDVREKVQFDICHLDGSVNLPISDLTSGKALPLATAADPSTAGTVWFPSGQDPAIPVYVICRLGNDSQLAVKRFKEAGLDNKGKRYIGDIRDGFKAWKERVDRDWPEY